MALNFRLAYNANGIEYTDLFPKTSIEAISDVEGIYTIQELQVTIPPTQNLTQTIAISTTTEMVESNVRMYLISAGEQAQLSYNAITQIQITDNTLTLTYLFEKPSDSIDVKLVFFIKEVF